MEEDSDDLTDLREKKSFMVNYFFNMKDKKGLVNAKTLKAEKRLVQRMIAFLSLMCFFFGEISMTIEYSKTKFEKEMIQDILLFFVIAMKIILIVCIIMSNYISK